MSFVSLIPVAIKVLDWFIANEPAIEKDAVVILTKAKDILALVHSLHNEVAADAPAK